MREEKPTPVRQIIEKEDVVFYLDKIKESILYSKEIDYARITWEVETKKECPDGIFITHVPNGNK